MNQRTPKRWQHQPTNRVPASDQRFLTPFPLPHVYARRLYAGGVSGSQIQVDSGSSTSNYIAYYTRAAGLDNSGNAVVGWQQYDANWNPQLVVRRLDTFDMPLGSEIVVSTESSYSGGGPAVAMTHDDTTIDAEEFDRDRLARRAAGPRSAGMTSGTTLGHWQKLVTKYVQLATDSLAVCA